MKKHDDPLIGIAELAEALDSMEFCECGHEKVLHYDVSGRFPRLAGCVVCPGKGKKCDNWRVRKETP